MTNVIYQQTRYIHIYIYIYIYNVFLYNENIFLLFKVRYCKIRLCYHAIYHSILSDLNRVVTLIIVTFLKEESRILSQTESFAKYAYPCFLTSNYSRHVARNILIKI